MHKAQLIQLIDQVIAQGEKIRTSNTRGVTGQSFSATWYPRVMSIFHVLGSHADPWKSAVAKCPSEQTSGMNDKLIGVLQAIREAVDRGLLDEIEDAAQVDTLSSLLDRARALAHDGYSNAAGSIGLTVMYEHLRECCVRSACPLPGTPRADELATQLFRRGHLSDQQRRLVRSVCEVGLDCQEERSPARTETEVLTMLDEVAALITANQGSERT